MNIKYVFIMLSIILLCIILIFYTINIEKFADYYPKLTEGSCRTSRGPTYYPKFKSLLKYTENECKQECDKDPLCDAYAYAAYDQSMSLENCQLFNTNNTTPGYNKDGTDNSLLDIVQKSNTISGGLPNNVWNCNIKIKKYRYYKWVITDVRTIGAKIEVGKIYFYDKNKQVIINPNLRVVSIPNSDSPSGKTADNLILYDNNNNNSWIDNKGVYDPERAGPSKAPTNNNGGLVYFDFGENYINLPRVEYFDWITSNNDKGRDPIWWSFFGTNEKIDNHLTDIYNKLKWDLLHYQDPYIISNFNTDQITNYASRLNVLSQDTVIPAVRNTSASNGKLFELTYPNCSCTKLPAPIPTIPPCPYNQNVDTISTNLSSIKEKLNMVNTYYANLKTKVDKFFNIDVIQILDKINTDQNVGLNKILLKINSEKSLLNSFLIANPNINLKKTVSTPSSSSMPTPSSSSMPRSTPSISLTPTPTPTRR